MLLSSMAEAMYWCGRYVERAQALSRVITSYERLGMDLQGPRPLDLKPLAALIRAGDDGGKLPGTRAGLLQALVLDEANPSSVLGALSAARENLRNARVIVPPELWQVLNRSYARVSDARGCSEAALLDALDETIGAAGRFDGERADNMLRDAAHAFLSIGCRVERADMLLRSLEVLLPVLKPDGWERAFDDVRWIGLLNALGVTSMYRRRHHVNADTSELLGLVLVAGDCPRSVAACLRAIEEKLRLLPHAGRVRAAVSLVEREGAALRSGAAKDAVMPDVERALQALSTLHETLQASYFPVEQVAALQAGLDKAERPEPTDPFDYLAREHQRAESVLRLLE